MELILYILAMLIGSTMVWYGSVALETSAENLSTYYRLPPIVRGAIVLAIGSSMPELSSTVLSTLIHNEFELGLSVVIGSAIFNILVIPGLSGVISKKKLIADKELVYKDSMFYIISVAVIFIIFLFAYAYHPVSDNPKTGVLTRWIMLVPVVFYLIYIYIQFLESRDKKEEAGDDKLEGEAKKPVKQWLLLLWSMLLIVVGVEGLVRGSIFMGEYFGTPSFLWGITVIATVTSLPDMFVSIRLAIKGEGITSLSNVLGSNVFDLLICVPAGVLIAGAVDVNLDVATPLMTYLSFVTIILFIFLRLKLVLTKPESWILLLLYALFVVFIFLDTFQVVEWVGSE